MAIVKITDFAEKIGLKINYGDTDQTMDLTSADINRVGLQLAGFFDYFAYERVQIIGNVESYYMKSLSDEKLNAIFDKLFKFDFPCIIIDHGTEVPPYLKKKAIEKKCPIFTTDEATTLTIQKLIPYLQNLLADYITIHGVLVDVYGVGLMLVGNSGIGKSETALELVKRGHRLVADDAVLIKKVSPTRLTGESPDNIRYLMEIRGIGIIDVRNMYGVGSVIDKKSIDMVILMEPWNENQEYDRLGIETKYYDILDVNIPMYTIPIRPGRNLAIIMEVAARNFRLKSMGHNAAEELINRLSKNNEEF